MRAPSGHVERALDAPTVEPTAVDSPTICTANEPTAVGSPTICTTNEPAAVQPTAVEPTAVEPASPTGGGASACLPDTDGSAVPTLRRRRTGT